MILVVLYNQNTKNDVTKICNETGIIVQNKLCLFNEVKISLCNRGSTILCSWRAPANKRKLGQWNIVASSEVWTHDPWFTRVKFYVCYAFVQNVADSESYIILRKLEEAKILNLSKNGNIWAKILTRKNIKSTQRVLLLGPSPSWNFMKWDWVQCLSIYLEILA